MTLSAAFNIISSSFAANAGQTAVVSSNIANANTPGYSREIANVITNSYGCADRRGRRTTGDFQRPHDARRDGERQRFDFFDLGRKPKRRFALGDARQF